MKGTTMDYTLLMTRPCPFLVGKLLEVRKEGHLYFVSSHGKDIGLLKEACASENEHGAILPESFNGVVVSSGTNPYLLTLRVWLNHNESHTSL